MKKALLIFGFGLFLLASCKKDYTCACKIDGQTVSTITINDTKKNATATCDESDANILGVVQDCSIQ
ncbi:MAG: hypothetical protein RL110_664 [Bacteroidota bacterium]|jgi:hypothetical protein|nr:hypothetical protein [Flavobacteriia bacterium]